MIPIPKRLLIHTASYTAQANEDKWGGFTTDEPITLSYVRLDPDRKLVVDDQNRQIICTATLFYDCTNSTPQNFTFETGGIVEFGGCSYRVETVQPLYDVALHHYEIGLSQL